MTAPEIRRHIRDLKREMRESGVRIISSMNAGLTREEYAANANLFRLKVELQKALAPKIP